MTKTTTFFTLLFSLAVSGVFGQAGTLDNSFNTTGFVNNHSVGQQDVYNKIVVQPDGKIVAVGSNVEDNTGVLFARYNTDGSLDNTFGTGGYVEFISGPATDRCYSLALQNDGKIVGVGSSTVQGSEHMVLWRLNSNGTFDDTFGNEGFLQPDYMYTSRLYDVTIQPDGKIVAVGSWEGKSNIEFLVIRLYDDGGFDETFGFFPGIAHEFISFDESEAKAVKLLNDGSLLVAGSSYFEDDNSNLCLAKYTSTGYLDTTFGPNSQGFTGLILENVTIGEDIALADDGDIVVAGSYNTNNSNTFSAIIAKFNTDGNNTDGGFGTNNGYSLLGTAGANALVIEDNNTIIFGMENGLIGRVNPNGNSDLTFGNQGYLAAIGNNGTIKSVALQSDGKLLAAGSANTNFLVARYTNLVLGVVDFTANNAGISAYPNPVSNQLTLDYTLLKDEVLSINLYDMQGKLVCNFASNKTTAKGQHVETLTLPGNLAAGSYVLSLSNNTGNAAIQIVKQ